MINLKENIKRHSYTVRLNPDLWKQLKHLAVDEKRSVSELVEEGIKKLLTHPKWRKD